MKRNKPKINKARSALPLLWQECEGCGKEFRFESVWAFTVNSLLITLSYSKHAVCKECEPTREGANKFARDFALIKNTLTTPTMPKCKSPKGGYVKNPPPENSKRPPPPPAPPPIRMINEDLSPLDSCR